jgi:hypothetical protein
MSEHITITHERTDDIPVIIAFLLKMRVAELIDKHFPTQCAGTRPDYRTPAEVYFNSYL